jgi:hypothetical protein
MISKTELLDRYSYLINNEVGSPMNFGIECGKGWLPLLEALLERLSSLNIEGLQIVQIKEKFGMLRVYIDGTTDKVRALVAAAEKLSGTICESCGREGKLRGRGWCYTNCDTCHAVWQSRRVPVSIVCVEGSTGGDLQRQDPCSAGDPQPSTDGSSALPIPLVGDDLRTGNVLSPAVQRDDGERGSELAAVAERIRQVLDRVMADC